MAAGPHFGHLWFRQYEQMQLVAVLYFSYSFCTIPHLDKFYFYVFSSCHWLMSKEYFISISSNEKASSLSWDKDSYNSSSLLSTSNRLIQSAMSFSSLVNIYLPHFSVTIIHFLNIQSLDPVILLYQNKPEVSWQRTDSPFSLSPVNGPRCNLNLKSQVNGISDICIQWPACFYLLVPACLI